MRTYDTYAGKFGEVSECQARDLNQALTLAAILSICIDARVGAHIRAKLQGRREIWKKEWPRGQARIDANRPDGPRVALRWQALWVVSVYAESAWRAGCSPRTPAHDLELTLAGATQPRI